MREGAIGLLPLAQSDGSIKPRPAVALRQLPGFGDWLVCGISTQLHKPWPASIKRSQPVIMISRAVA